MWNIVWLLCSSGELQESSELLNITPYVKLTLVDTLIQWGPLEHPNKILPSRDYNAK